MSTKQILIDEDTVKLALEVLERVNNFNDFFDLLDPVLSDLVVDTIDAVKEALAQSRSDVKQEQPYADKAASVSNDRIKIDPVTGNVQIGTSKQEQSAEHVGEPVAWMDKNKFEHLKKNNAVLTTVTSWSAFDDDVPLYTTPYVATQRQQRPFIKPLTDERIDEIYFKSDLDIERQYNQLYAFVRAIEAAHGIT